MTILDELLMQRDAILFGTHVHRAPYNPGEACLLATSHTCECANTTPHYGHGWISTPAIDLIEDVLEDSYGWTGRAWEWNDDTKPSREDALSVLEEAIRRAKEQVQS